MPTFQGVISSEDLVAVIEYIRTLKPNQTPARGELPAAGQPAGRKSPRIPAGAKPETDNSPKIATERVASDAANSLAFSRLKKDRPKNLEPQ